MTDIRSRSVAAGFAAAFAAVTLQAAPLAAQEAPVADSAAAVEATENWLGLLDAGDFEAALSNAAPMLQDMAGNAASWSSFIGMARAEFPGAPDRNLAAFDADPELTGAPPGDYRSLVFVVGQDGEISERVVVVRHDGRWKVAMYGVRGAG